MQKEKKSVYGKKFRIRNYSLLNVSRAGFFRKTATLSSIVYVVHLPAQRSLERGEVVIIFVYVSVQSSSFN